MGFDIYIIIQARSQGTFEVEALSGRGVLGPPWGPQWVQGEALVGAKVAKPPEATGFNTFTMQFSALKIILSSISCLWFLLHDFTCKTIAFQYYSSRSRNGTFWFSIHKWGTYIVLIDLCSPYYTHQVLPVLPETKVQLLLTPNTIQINGYFLLFNFCCILWISLNRRN